MKILTDLQEDALNAFFAQETLRQHFYLTGGTALAAFYFQHRLSDDLDFFTHSVDLDSTIPLAEDAWHAAGLDITRERSSPTYRRYRLNGELQIDLVRDIDFRVGAPELHDTYMVDSRKNIAVNKITAIYGRLDAKDYIDLYFLAQEPDFDFFALFALAQQKDGGLEDFQWARIIADVDTLTILPRMLRPFALPTLRKFYHHLHDMILDRLKKDTR